MKFDLFVVLSCLSVVFVSGLTVHNWGNVTNAQRLGIKKVFVKTGLFDVDAKEHTFKYPEVCLNSLPDNFVRVNCILLSS